LLNGDGGTSSIIYSADGRNLVATTGIGYSRIWRFAAYRGGTPLVVASAAIPSQPLSGAAFSVDGDVVAGSGSERVVRLWGSRAHLALDLVRTSAAPAAAAFGPEGRLTVADLDGMIRLVLVQARLRDALHPRPAADGRRSWRSIAPTDAGKGARGAGQPSYSTCGG
jgi:WD40 repeat protein